MTLAGYATRLSRRMLRSQLATGLIHLSTRCAPPQNILTSTSIFLRRQLSSSTVLSQEKSKMPPKQQATLGQFFTLPPGTKPAPLEQTKLSTGSSAKGSKATKASKKGEASKRDEANSGSAEREAPKKAASAEVAKGEDEVMDDAPPAAAEEESIKKSAEKEKPKAVGKKRGRSPSDQKSSVKPLAKKAELAKYVEAEMVDAEPAPKKRGKLARGRKEKDPSPAPEPKPEKGEGVLINEGAKSEPESESEAVKPARRRGRPPKAAEVAEDMQKVKISEKEIKNTKAKKQENEKPDPEEKPKESRSAPKKSSNKASPVVKSEPTEERSDDDEALVSDSESPSSSEESSLKKPVITAAARKQVQAKLVSGGHPYPDWPTGSPVPYAALCKSFSLIESTTKRLEKLQHTSLLLRQVLRLTPNELLLVVHLMCNKLAADFEGIELGIGESLLMKAIAESCGRAMDKIKADHNQIGDLGVVAQQSRSNQSTLMFHKPKQLTVTGVHDTFLKIATTSGGGAQGGKVSLIKQLLANAAKEGDEAKYIVRALEGKMRLGLAERTIEVAISQAVVTWEQEKSEKKPSLAQLQEAEEIIKGVYSELPSYEVIIPALIEHGISNLRQNCRMQPGVPLKPMLAKPTKAITEVLDKFENKTFTCEYKYDGERSQIHFVSKDSKVDYPKTTVDTNKIDKGVAKIFSRNSEDLSKKYPDILGVLDTWIKPGVESFILDCETVGWDKEEKKLLPFQQLMTRKKKDVIVEDVKVRVCVFAFDLLFLNGKPLVKETLQERRRLMYESFSEVEGQFSFAKAMDGNELEQIQSFLDESIKDSCEGLMVKMLLGSESSYEPSVRSINWLKIKKDYLAGVGDSLDLVVVGAYFGRGKRTSVYGAFLLACYNTSKQTYETICNIGTGFSEQVLEEHYKALSEHVIDRPKPYYSHSTVNTHAPDVWFEPRMVWEVKTADMTLSPKYRAAEGLVDSNKGISLRFPRFLRIRDDKGPEQATNARQVAEMYRKQESVGGGKKGVDDDFEY